MMKRVLKKIIDMYYKIFADSLHSNIRLNSPYRPLISTYFGIAIMFFMNCLTLAGLYDLLFGTHFLKAIFDFPYYLKEKLYFLPIPAKFFALVIFAPCYIIVYFTVIKRKDWILENYPYRKRKYLIIYSIITILVFWGIIFYFGWKNHHKI